MMKAVYLLSILAALFSTAALVPAPASPANVENSPADTLASFREPILTKPPSREADSAAVRAREIAAGQPLLDRRLFRFFNRTIENRFLDRLMPAVTNFDNSRIIVLLIWSALVIFGKGRGRWAALALIPLLVASDQISSGLLKPMVQRLRPVEVLGGVHFWNEDSGWITTPVEVTRSYKSSFSFPSGHATNITASMLFLGLIYRRLIAPLLAVAVIVSISRMYVGVHWPIDVASGMLLGALLGAAAYLIFRKYAPWNSSDFKEQAHSPDR